MANDQRLVIEGYDVGAVTSRGPWTTVHAAHDLARDVPVSIRVCSDLAVDLARAQRAAEYLRQRTASVEHRNLLPVHDVIATEAGDICIVTDVEVGGPVSGFLRAGPVPVHVALELGVRIADALSSAHAAVPAVLHGRVTPDDILVGLDGEPLLADLGVASLLPLRGGDASPHVAPEQLDGLPVTPYTDVYGLGSTLYTLLSGHTPFGGPDDEDDDEFRRRVRTDPVPELRRLDLPELGERAIYTALAKDPRARFPSAAAMRDALAVARTAYEAGPEVAGAEAPRPPRRGRRRSAAPALISLVLVVAVIVLVIVFSALGR